MNDSEYDIYEDFYEALQQEYGELPEDNAYLISQMILEIEELEAQISLIQEQSDYFFDLEQEKGDQAAEASDLGNASENKEIQEFFYLKEESLYEESERYFKKHLDKEDEILALESKIDHLKTELEEMGFIY